MNEIIEYRTCKKNIVPNLKLKNIYNKSQLDKDIDGKVINR